MVILDATASNRSMWPNKNPPTVIFMDRELLLAIPPTIFADFRYCPFRNNIFSVIFFDPPYYVRRDNNWMFYNPDLTKKFGKRAPAHYDVYRSRIELLTNIAKGVKEFLRLSPRLCFQWGTGFISIWRILSLFKPWKEIFRKDYSGGGYQRKSKMVWVTFVRGVTETDRSRS